MHVFSSLTKILFWLVYLQLSNVICRVTPTVPRTWTSCRPSTKTLLISIYLSRLRLLFSLNAR